MDSLPTNLKIAEWDKLGIIKKDHDPDCAMDAICTDLITLAIHFKYLGLGDVERITAKVRDSPWQAAIERLPLEEGYLAEWVLTE
jgi:hypothetical protein